MERSRCKEMQILGVAGTQHIDESTASEAVDAVGKIWRIKPRKPSGSD